MNITFLIGNGFDIASGTDTSYKTFCKWYCEQLTDKEHIKKFKNDIKNDIENGGKDWADFEIGLGQYTKNFTIDNISEFIDCYEDAHEKIIKFIEKQKAEFNLDDLPKDEIMQFGNGIANFYQDLSPQEVIVFNNKIENDKLNNTKVNFLSFNYTNTLDKIVQELSKSCIKQWSLNNGATRRMEVNKNILHMHGTSTDYPILGVDNTSQIANQELLSNTIFTQMIIKPQSVEAIGEVWHNTAQKIISSSTIIGVFGMSLGETDTKWWQEIMSWLKSDGSRHLILYWYTKNPPNGISIYRRLLETKKAKDALLKYVKFSQEDINKIETRIHVVINTKNVFNIHLEKNNSTVTTSLSKDSFTILDSGEIA